MIFYGLYKLNALVVLMLFFSHKSPTSYTDYVSIVKASQNAQRLYKWN